MPRQEVLPPGRQVSAAAPSTGDTWTVQRLTDERAFARLAEEWDDLAARCSTATPFQLSGWLLPWWRQYGPSDNLRTIVVRHEGVLVGGAALFLERRHGLPVLAPLGRGLADMIDILLDDSHADSAAMRLVAAIRSDTGWRLLDVPHVRPDASVLRLAHAWPLPRDRQCGPQPSRRAHTWREHGRPAR